MIARLFATLKRREPEARMPRLDRAGRDIFGIVHAERVTR